MDDDRQKAFKAYVSATGNDSISAIEEDYEGEYDSEEDFASYIVSELYDLERWAAFLITLITRLSQGICLCRTTSLRMAMSSADKRRKPDEAIASLRHPPFYNATDEIYSE